MRLNTLSTVIAISALVLITLLTIIYPRPSTPQTTVITKQNKLPIHTQPPPEEPINQLPTEGPGELEDKPEWHPTIMEPVTDNEKHIVPPETQVHVDVCTRFGGHKVITHHGVYWHCVYPRR